jgi:hypothetical protein
MYIAPPKENFFLGKYSQSIQSKVFNDNGKPGIIYIGFLPLMLSAYWLYILLKRRALKEKEDAFLIVASTFLFILAIIAFWFSLKPRFHVLGKSFVNPAYFIALITPAWRVFGRLFAIVSIAISITSGLGLKNLLKFTHSVPRKVIIFATASALLVLDIHAFPATSLTYTFDYSKDVPAVYLWLRNEPNIKAIAEYPLDEPPQGKYLSDYYTFQTISNKPLLNSFLPNSNNASFRRSIAGINDPQTIPVLRALEVGLVNVRSNELEKPYDIPSVSDNSVQNIFKHKDKHPIDSYIIAPGLAASYALVINDLKYYQVFLSEKGNAEYKMPGKVQLSLKQLSKPKASSNESVSVSLNLKADKERNSIIIQNGRLLWSGRLNTSPVGASFKADPKQEISILTEENEQDLAHLSLSSLNAQEL